MSRAGWSKAASLQVVVVPWRQKHQKIPGSGPRHQSKAMCFPDSKAAEWDCSTHWELFNLNVAFSLFVRLMKYKTSEGIEHANRNWMWPLQLTDQTCWGRGCFFYICVYCHLLNCRVTEEQESMEASLMLLFYFKASSLPGLVLYFCPYVIF